MGDNSRITRFIETTFESLFYKTFSIMGLIYRATRISQPRLFFLNRMIPTWQEALATTPPGHPDRFRNISRLGGLLGERSTYNGDMEDSRAAVGMLLEAANAYPRGDTERVTLLDLVTELLMRRFINTQNWTDSNYEEVMRVTQEAFEETAEGHAAWENSLQRFVGVRVIRFFSTGDEVDLDELICASKGVIGRKPPDSLYWPILEIHIFLLGERYSLTADTADLDAAIGMLREAFNATPEGHPDRVKWLSVLGVRLSNKFSCTGDMTHLDEAVRTSQEAVDLSQGCDESTRVALLNNLGLRLGERHVRTGSMVDIEEAIRIMREVVKKTPKDHIDRKSRLSNLGLQLGNRWFLTRENIDLEDAICLMREGLDEIKPDHYVDRGKLSNFGIQLPTQKDRQVIPHDYLIDKGKLLNNLGIRLGDRYSITQALEDLNEAICRLQEATDIVPSNYPDRTRWLTNLGQRLHERYSRTKNAVDLDQAIFVTEKARDLAPTGHPNQAYVSSYLGIYLGDRYSRTGQMEDLKESIRKAREAVSATSVDHPERGSWLSNLGLRLGNMYSRTGAMADLEEAIRIAKEALVATPRGHPQRASRLSNLGFWLSDRYTRIGAMVDLDESLRLTEDAIEATPERHPERPAYLNNLGLRLSDKYIRTGDLKYLNQGIRKLREAVNATTKGHPDLAKWSNNLSLRLGERYAHRKRIVDETNDREEMVKIVEDLDEAYNTLREFADDTSSNHTERAAFLNNLGLLLGERYLNSGMIADLDRTISTTLKSVEATPKDHLHRAKRLVNLARQLYQRYAATGEAKDLEGTRECLVEALHSSTSSISIRVEAGREFLLTKDVLADPRTYDVAKTTVGLIPLLTPRSLQNTDKRHLLAAAVGISSDAAAIALHLKKGPLAAINCLETGRAVIAGAVLQQHDVSLLQKAHPDLATYFLDLRDQLDSPDSRDSDYLVDDESAAAEAKADRRRAADQELTHLLQKIRSTAGFESFLLPASEADMIDAARHGPVVVLNVSMHRCDALIVQQPGIKSLPLSRITPEDIDDYVTSLDSIETLEWLWYNIIYPVLDAIDLTKPSPDLPLPRVWWVPTGKLTKFPLHAAGIHEIGFDGDAALDVVVSSYASSVKGIIHGRRQQKRRQPLAETDLLQRVVTVAMERTEEMKPLPYACREIDEVLAVLGLEASSENRPEETKEKVLPAIKACQIFHFAGHGYTDAAEPLRSSLRLRDWRMDPLTVQDLLDADLNAAAPFLAYLSACGTSLIKDERSVDESIHLANAFQLAGFCHVIGTLWKVEDGLCVSVAKMLYRYLRENGLEDECVSRGLHHAARIHRDEWLRDSTCGSEVDGGFRAELVEDPTTPALWIPYVHFGV
ncbi:CHAT domain-containing protein [Hypoxylon cercidicola]|nr:CHAT domain-containing protein [Hypoxylon cercidicola]